MKDLHELYDQYSKYRAECRWVNIRPKPFSEWLASRPLPPTEPALTEE